MSRFRKSGLASARTRSGDEVVGTRDALVLPGRQIPWERILRADWDSEAEVLRVVLVEPEVVDLELEEPALLLQLVRERVTASIVLTRRVPVDGDLGLVLMARRPPRGGEITLTFEYDRGLDPDAPDVRDVALAAARAARDDLGL